MQTRLPPLNALKVFEVAARKLSFSLAAEELCVTQGAVSKQIKLLEQHLELALFDRINGGLKLTDAGQKYLPSVMQALDQIQSSTSSLQQFATDTNHITVDVTPSFSSLWLIPRLGQLNQTIPEVKLDIICGDGSYQFHQASADIAIRCLPLSIVHDNAILLREEKLVPVIHHSLLTDGGGDGDNRLKKRAQLLNYPLLIHTTRPQLWPRFINSEINQGDLLPTPKFSHGFEHFYMSLEAAKQQQGIALVPDFLAQQAIVSGELVNPLDICYPSGYGFYFLTPAYRYSNTTIQALFEWFKASLQSNID